MTLTVSLESSVSNGNHIGIGDVVLAHARRRLLPLLDQLVPVLDRASTRVTAQLPLVEAVLNRVDPVLSLHRVRARVVAVQDETHDVKTYLLKPNARFGSFRPGAFVNLHLSIDGKPVQRSYSLSTAPSADGLVAITVKRVPGGVVSNWLADRVQPGHVLELSAPQGQFLLPEQRPAKLLLISAGSGITPVMSMLRQLVAERAGAEIAFLHFARSPRDLIFERELAEIERRHANVRITLCVEESSEGWQGARGRFSESLLAQAAPEFREMPTFLCGPSGFMRAVMQTLEHTGADLSLLRYERFNTEFDASLFLEHAQVLRFVRSGAESLSTRPRTILEEAENLGVPIQSGCRAGNCGTCRCTKKSGVVIDVLTGRESSAGEEPIYPCISVARGTVELDL